MKKVRFAAAAIAVVLALSSCGGAQENTAKDDTKGTSAAEETKKDTPKSSEGEISNKKDNDKSEDVRSSDTKDDKSEEKDNDSNSTEDIADNEKSYTTIGANGIPIIEHMGGYNSIGKLENGLVLITRNKGFYIADASGNVVSEVIDDETETTRLGNDTFLHGGKIYDKNCKIIIDPEMMGFDDYLAINDNYVIVYKVDSGFSGDTVSIGVLDTEGNWIQPLSDKAKLFEYDIDKKALVSPQNADNLRRFYDDSDDTFSYTQAAYKMLRQHCLSLSAIQAFFFHCSCAVLSYKSDTGISDVHTMPGSLPIHHRDSSVFR